MVAKDPSSRPCRVWLNSKQKQKHSNLDCRQDLISKITAHFRAFEFSLTLSHWFDVCLQVLLASDSTCSTIWTLFSAASVQNTVNV